jgi:hypothetical protein
MPGPQRTKGTLKNTQFKSRMARKNKTLRRKQAFYIHQLNARERQEYLRLVAEFALYISRKLEREGKIKPVESCDGFFDTYYDANDSFKILQEISKHSTKERQINQYAKREFQSVRRSTPGIKFNLKAIFVFVLLTCAKQTDAKWNELHAPPDEISAPDTIAATLATSGWAMISSGEPTLASIGTVLVVCGFGASAYGSGVRLYNDYTGTYPLKTGDKVAESLALLPGSGPLLRTIGSYVEPEQFTSRVKGAEGLINAPVNRFVNRHWSEANEKEREAKKKEITSTYNEYLAPYVAKTINTSQIVSAEKAVMNRFK